MRKMKKFPDPTIATYTNFSMIIFFAVLMGLEGDSFTYYPSIWTWVDWLLIASTALTNILASITKFKAIQNWETSKIAVFSYSSAIISCIFVLTIFDLSYTPYQWVAFILTVLIFVVELYAALTAPAKKPKTEAVEEDKEGDVVDVDDVRFAHREYDLNRSSIKSSLMEDKIRAQDSVLRQSYHVKQDSVLR